MKRAEKKPRRTRATERQTKGSGLHAIEEIIEESSLPPAEQALLPTHKLNTKAARPKKGRRKQGAGLEPILEHHDIKDDPYCVKPVLLTHMK